MAAVGLPDCMIDSPSVPGHEIDHQSVLQQTHVPQPNTEEKQPGMAAVSQPDFRIDSSNVPDHEIDHPSVLQPAHVPQPSHEMIPHSVTQPSPEERQPGIAVVSKPGCSVTTPGHVICTSQDETDSMSEGVIAPESCPPTNTRC